jgi:hypothetical protein
VPAWVLGEVRRSKAAHKVQMKGDHPRF